MSGVAMWQCFFVNAWVAKGAAVLNPGIFVECDLVNRAYGLQRMLHCVGVSKPCVGPCLCWHARPYSVMCVFTEP